MIFLFHVDSLIFPILVCTSIFLPKYHFFSSNDYYRCKFRFLFLNVYSYFFKRLHPYFLICSSFLCNLYYFCQSMLFCLYIKFIINIFLCTNPIYLINSFFFMHVFDFSNFNLYIVFTTRVFPFLNLCSTLLSFLTFHLTMLLLFYFYDPVLFYFMLVLFIIICSIFIVLCIIFVILNYFICV